MMNTSNENEITLPLIVKSLLVGASWGVVLFIVGAAALVAIVDAWNF